MKAALASAVVQARINSALFTSAVANRLFFNRRPVDRMAIRKVLVIQTRDLGDVVLATVLLEPLRLHFPNARIVFVVGEWARDLVAASPLIDNVVIYCSDLASNANPKQHTLGTRLRAIRQIIAEAPDLVLELRGDLGTLAAAILSGARHRGDRGTWRFRDIMRNLVVHRMPGLSHDIHEVNVALEIARSLGVVARDRQLRLSAKDDEFHAVDQLLARHFPLKPRLVVLHPGASKDGKIWPAERFAALADHIAARSNTCFLITGSEKERPLSAAITRALQHPGLDLCGRLTLRQLYALYCRCALWIGNDTGPMHIAAAAAIPVVALWGPLSTPKYYPFTARRLIIAAPDRADHIASITTEHAWRQLQRFLDDEWAWCESVKSA